jgi:tetratricopeptide (TPR) repeat protein
MSVLCWFRGTCSDPNFSAADEAVKWAERAEQREPTADHEFTLAAAYAEAERWDDAVQAQAQAIERLPPWEAEHRKNLEAALARFEKHDPIRE